MKKETKFFDTQVCVGEPASPSPGVRRFNQTLQHIESSRLDAFAEKKLLLAGKALHRGHQPQNETVVRLQGRARGARAIRVLGAVAFVFVIRLQTTLLRSLDSEDSVFRTKGASPLGTPKR